MTNKINKRKKVNHWVIIIIMFCTMITPVIIVWSVINPMIEETNIINQAFVTLFTGIGALGFGMVFLEILDKFFNRIEETLL